MIGMLNIYSFETFEKTEDTSRFPLRTIIAYKDKNEEKVKNLEDWKKKRFVFIREELLPPELSPQQIWDVWKKEFLKKKEIRDVELYINLHGTDAVSKGIEEKKEKIIEEVKSKLKLKLYAHRYSRCIKEDCPENVFKNLTEAIAKAVLNEIFPIDTKESSEAEIKTEIKRRIFSGVENGKSVKLRVYRHRKWNQQDKKIKENWNGDDIFITLSGAMMGFSVIKNIKNSNDEIEIFKLAERFLYRILIIDERVMRYVLDKGKENIENLHYAGVDIGMIEVRSKNREITCFKDKNLKEKIEEIRTENSKYIPTIKINVEDKYIQVKLYPDKNSYDIAIVHISCLEKLGEELGIERESFIQSIVDNLKEAVPNIFLTTGRGRINLKHIKDTKFIPFSIINATLYGGFVDKILLIDSVSLIRGGVNDYGKR